MTVNDAGRSVGSPTGVCNRDLRVERLGAVDVGLGDLRSEASDLANLLEEPSLAGLITINTNTCRVVTTVLLASETVAENVANRPAVLKSGNDDDDQ